MSFYPKPSVQPVACAHFGWRTLAGNPTSHRIHRHGSTDIVTSPRHSALCHHILFQINALEFGTRARWRKGGCLVSLFWDSNRVPLYLYDQGLQRCRLLMPLQRPAGMARALERVCGFHIRYLGLPQLPRAPAGVLRASCLAGFHMQSSMFVARASCLAGFP